MSGALWVAGATLIATAAVSYPTYDRVLLLETTSETSANASFGDLNGDGNLDIVLAKGRHWPLVDRVLIGDGTGGIAASYDLGVASDKSYSGRLADLDGDGDLDVVISVAPATHRAPLMRCLIGEYRGSPSPSVPARRCVLESR